MRLYRGVYLFCLPAHACVSASSDRMPWKIEAGRTYGCVMGDTDTIKAAECSVCIVCNGRDSQSVRKRESSSSFHPSVVSFFHLFQERQAIVISRDLAECREIEQREESRRRLEGGREEEEEEYIVVYMQCLLYTYTLHACPCSFPPSASLLIHPGRRRPGQVIISLLNLDHL